MENSKIKEQIIKSNYAKLRYISLISLGFSVFTLCNDFLSNGVWNEKAIPYYVILDIAFAIISVSAVAFFWLLKIKNIRWLKSSTIIFPFLILIWSALIAGVDFNIYGFLTFIIIVLLTTFFLNLNIVVSIVFFVASSLAVFATLFFLQDINDHYISIIFLLFPIICVSVLISSRNYKSKLKDLLNQEKMMELNQKLLDSYENLEKEVEKRTVEIQTVLNKTEENEKKFLSYLENMPVGVLVANEKGTYLEVNKTACQITGYSQDELLSMSSTDLISPESIEAAGDLFSKVVNTGYASGELQYKHKNGTGRIWHVDAVKLSGTRILWFVKDITERIAAEKELKEFYKKLEAGKVATLNLLQDVKKEIEDRKQAQEALRESKDYLNKIINTIPSPIFVKDDKHKFTLVNEAFCKLINIPAGELIGTTGYEYFSKEKFESFIAGESEVFELGIESIKENSIPDREGNLKTFIARKTLYTDVSGNKSLVGVLNDITERKRAEVALQENNARLELAMQSANMEAKGKCGGEQKKA